MVESSGAKESLLIEFSLQFGYSRIWPPERLHFKFSAHKIGLFHSLLLEDSSSSMITYSIHEVIISSSIFRAALSTYIAQSSIAEVLKMTPPSPSDAWEWASPRCSRNLSLPLLPLVDQLRSSEAIDGARVMYQDTLSNIEHYMTWGLIK